MAGIKPFLLALAAVAVSAQDPSNFTISHSCIILADGNWRMELTIDGRGNQVDRVQAVNASEAPQEVLCDNTPVGGGNAVQEFTALDGSDTFFFRADIVTSSGAVTPDCGQLTSPDEGLTVGEYKWFVKVESDAFHPDIQLAFEKTYIITCDFNDPASTRNETIDTIVQVNNPPTPEVIDLQKDGDLDIVLADNFSPVNTIASGTLTRIKAFLVTENVAPVNPPRTGVSPYNCRACRDDACSGTVIQLTDIDGCVVGNTLSASFTNTVGPEMSPNGDVLYSGTFEIFSFSESLNSPVGNVVFTCKFDYCDSTTGPALCTNRCTTRTGGRKRREVSLDHKSRNIRESGVTTAPSSGDKTGDDVSVTVKVVKDTLMRERNPVTGQFLNGGVEVKMINSPRTITRKDDDELCNGHTGFIAGACILGVSLVVAVAACVFFCVKISRVRSEKTGSLGHSNLAFQQH